MAEFNIHSKFIIPKLDYIHWNPCTGKWKLANCPENYIHSSAGFYSKGIQEVFPVDDIILMMDID